LTFYLVLSFHENFSKVFVGKNSTIPRRISVTDISEVTDCRQEKKKKHFKMFHYRCTSAILLSLKHQLLLLLLLLLLIVTKIPAVVVPKVWGTFARHCWSKTNQVTMG
jgi:hypothetical protein